MSRADYTHWNEEADLVWWAEEGRHIEEDRYDADENWRDEPEPEPEPDDDDDDPEHPFGEPDWDLGRDLERGK